MLRPSIFDDPELLSSNGLDGYKAPHAPAVDKFYLAGNLRKERVIAATANVEAGLQRGATLPHNDRSTGDKLATEGLHAQPLCI